MNKLYEVFLDKTNNKYRFSCPHCEGGVEVNTNEINCRIFRHGVFIANNTNIPPHSSEKDCNSWANTNKIYGCGKPIQMISDNGKIYIKICNYI